MENSFDEGRFRSLEFAWNEWARARAYRDTHVCDDASQFSCFVICHNSERMFPTKSSFYRNRIRLIANYLFIKMCLPRAHRHFAFVVLIIDNVSMELKQQTYNTEHSVKLKISWDSDRVQNGLKYFGKISTNETKIDVN